MNRLLCVLAVLLVAADPPKFSSKSAQQTATKFKLAVEKAKQDHEKAVGAAQAEYVESLKAAMSEETKKGNLDGAVEIRDALKIAEAKRTGGPTLIERLAGTVWVNSRGKLFRWDENGRFTNDGNPWLCVPVDDNRVAIVYESAHVDVLVFDKMLTKFESWYGAKSKDTPAATGQRVTTDKPKPAGSK
jgi:hypothetical protein